MSNGLFTSPPPSSSAIVTGLGKTFPPKNVGNTAEALAAAYNINQSGTLNNALQPQLANNPVTAPSPNSSLAATINPAVNIQLSAQLNVSDFINTAANAFTPAPATPAPPAPPTTSPADAANAYGQNSPAPNPASGNSSNSYQPPAQTSAAATGSSTPTAVYSAVADAGASTIRGAGLNVVA